VVPGEVVEELHGTPSVKGSVGPVVVVVVQPAGEGVQAGLVAQVEPGIWAGVKTYDLAGVPVRVLFAPDHTPELEIVKQLLKGSRSATSRSSPSPALQGSTVPCWRWPAAACSSRGRWIRGRPPRTGPPPSGSGTQHQAVRAQAGRAVRQIAPAIVTSQCSDDGLSSPQSPIGA
jgi:hypothetical protein